MHWAILFALELFVAACGEIEGLLTSRLQAFDHKFSISCAEEPRDFKPKQKRKSYKIRITDGIPTVPVVAERPSKLENLLP